MQQRLCCLSCLDWGTLSPEERAVWQRACSPPSRVSAGGPGPVLDLYLSTPAFWLTRSPPAAGQRLAAQLRALGKQAQLRLHVLPATEATGEPCQDSWRLLLALSLVYYCGGDVGAAEALCFGAGSAEHTVQIGHEPARRLRPASLVGLRDLLYGLGPAEPSRPALLRLARTRLVEARRAADKATSPLWWRLAWRGRSVQRCTEGALLTHKPGHGAFVHVLDGLISYVGWSAALPHLRTSAIAGLALERGRWLLTPPELEDLGGLVAANLELTEVDFSAAPDLLVHAAPAPGGAAVPCSLRADSCTGLRSLAVDVHGGCRALQVELLANPDLRQFSLRRHEAVAGGLRASLTLPGLDSLRVDLSFWSRAHGEVCLELHGPVTGTLQLALHGDAPNYLRLRGRDGGGGYLSLAHLLVTGNASCLQELTLEGLNVGQLDWLVTGGAKTTFVCGRCDLRRTLLTDRHPRRALQLTDCVASAPTPAGQLLPRRPSAAAAYAAATQAFLETIAPPPDSPFVTTYLGASS